MMRLMWTSKGAMVSQQEKIDSISNNFANVSTTGYKKVNVSFSDLLNESLDREGYPIINRNNDRLQHSTGVKVNKWVRENNQGPLIQTGKNTDVALDGEGYFEVILKDGSKAYTRCGNFNLDKNGDLVDKNGNYISIVQGGRNVKISDLNLNFTENDLTISEEGIISIKQDQKFVQVGKLKVNSFVGDYALSSFGDSLYVRTPNSQMIEPKDYSVIQKFEEGSNVKLESEMTELIIAQRAFQLNSNALKTSDEMWSMVNNLRSR